MSARARFREADLTRAIRAFEKRGLPVSGAKIEPDGSITILTQLGLPANDINPLDRVFSR